MSFLKIRDLIRARKEHDSDFEPWRDITVAKVVAVEGSITASQPGYLWINLWGDEGSPTTAFNPGFSLAAGDWVKVGKAPKSPFRWSILEYWVGDIEPEYTGRVARHEIGIHGLNHQYPSEATIGVDPVKIYQPALQPLKTTGNSSDLTILIQTLIYIQGGIRRLYGGGTIDLTSSVPGAGLIRAVLVYLDTISNLAKTVDGTAVADDSVTPIPRPTLPSNGRASAYIILANGQTTIVNATDVEDARDFLASDTSAISTPTAIGQVLVANEYLQPEWVTPIIDENGYWMSGDDDQLVWE